MIANLLLRVVNWLLHGVLIFLLLCVDWSVVDTGRFSFDGDSLIVFLTCMAYIGLVVSISCAIYFFKRMDGGYARVASRGPRVRESAKVFVG